MTKLQTVFILNKGKLWCDSSFVNLDEVVSVFDRLNLRLLELIPKAKSKSKRTSHIHDYIRIGRLKVLEEAPQDALIEMIDDKKVIGRLFKCDLSVLIPQSTYGRVG
ncbi:MAG: hypothetical protein ACLS5K_04000 [Streptococcus salivarius]